MASEQISTELLRGFSPLDGLKRDNLAALARKVRIREMSPGQLLFKEGDTEKRTLYVLSGILELVDQAKVVGTVVGGSELARNPVAPVYPVIEDLVNRIITEVNKTEHPYDPEADGFIALIEKGDLDRPLTEIWGEDAYGLIDIPWEAIDYDESRQFFLAVFLANNRFGIVFVIPEADWLPDELRNVLEDNLIPTPTNSTI